MVNLFKKKKEPENALLYEKFKTREQPEDVRTTTVRAKVKKEVPVLRQPTGKQRKELIIPYSLAVCSLKNGCGCTHMAAAIASFLMKKQKKVFVVTQNLAFIQAFGIPCNKEMEQFSDYDHIIYDFGCMRDLEFSKLVEIKKCQGKIMMCMDSQLYLSNLANFVENELRFTKSWLYFFNFVPESRKREIEDIMEDHPHLCIPLFEISDNQKTEEILRKVW